MPWDKDEPEWPSAWTVAGFALAMLAIVAVFLVGVRWLGGG